VNDLPSRLGAAIKRRRLDVGLSQDALAAICDVSRSYLGQVERGEVSITVTLLEQVAKGLNVTLSEIVCGIDQK